MSEEKPRSTSNGIEVADAYKAHIAKSLPAELPLDEFLNFCARPLRRAIRVNTLKISVPEFLARSKDYPWELTAIPWCAEGFWVTHSEYERLGNHPDHILGLFYIQEASSMLPPVALFLNEKAEHALTLDMAAAPGSKTTQIAAITNNTGCLLANELSSSRLKSLYANLMRCGVNHAVLTHIDGVHFGVHAPEVFDFILLDAPCGGEGTVRKDPNALANWSLEQVEAMAQIQKALLRSAILSLKAGGTLVYSTCTLSPEENEYVVAALLSEFPNELEIQSLDTAFPGAKQAATSEGYLKIWPNTFDSEGFFVAKLKKKIPTLSATSNPEPGKTRLGKFPFEPISSEALRLLEKESQDAFGFSIEPIQHRLWQKDNAIWLFPEKLDAVLGKIKLDRIGLKLGALHRKGVQFLPEFLNAFSKEIKGNLFHCTTKQANDFLSGKDISIHEKLTGSFIVMHYQGYPLGLAKNLGNKLKNKLPRDRVVQGPVFSDARL